MDDSPPISIEIRSDPCYLAGVRQLIASVSQRIGLPDGACSKIALATDEALANVIRHGYCGSNDRPIWIRIWPTPAGEGGPGIRIVIEDEARHVDSCDLRGRDLDDPRPGGLGLHIINEVMDEVTYEKRSPTGMRLTMVKRADTGGEADG